MIVTLLSPEKSLYLGLKVEILIKISLDYPFMAPRMIILTPIKHLRVSPRDGHLNIRALDVDWHPVIKLAYIAYKASDELFCTPTNIQVSEAMTSGQSSELIDIANRSLDEYSDVVAKHSQSIINKEVPMRSIW